MYAVFAETFQLEKMGNS